MFLRNDPNYLSISLWEKFDTPLIGGITTRKLNMSYFDHNQFFSTNNDRKVFSETIHIPLSQWVGCQQVHHANIVVVNEKDCGKGSLYFQDAIDQADGLVTCAKNVLLTIYVADCVPIYFYDPVKEIIGLVHAGWRGTVQYIAGIMVQKMVSLGSDKKNIYVLIGPAISKNFYEIDESVISKIDTHFRKKVVTPTKENRYLLDLKAFNREILLQSGIFRHNINITTLCTYKDDDLFFSYRRDQGKTGRMLAYLGMFEHEGGESKTDEY